MTDTTRPSPPITPAHAHAMHRVISLWGYPNEVDVSLLRDIGAHLDSLLTTLAPGPSQPEETEPDCGDCSD